jgi:hypothetical protein
MVTPAQIIRDPSKLRDLFGSTPILIGDIRVDVLEEEAPAFAWDLPGHRVDAGTNVTNSRYQLPLAVTLDCIFLDPETSVDKALAAAVGFGWDRVPWREKRAALYDLAARNELITIITPSGVDYSNMMIDAIQPSITPRRSGGFWFRLSARRVELVSSETAGIDASLIPDALKPKKNEQAKKKTAKAGAKNQKTAQNAPEKRASILSKIVNAGSDALGGLF